MKQGAPAEGDRGPDFRLAVRTLLARRCTRLRRHPDAAVLVEFHRRRLPGRAAARLREHLALCAACGDLVLGLAVLARRRRGEELVERRLAGRMRPLGAGGESE